MVVVAPMHGEGVLADVAQATPAWLTGALRRIGVLGRGRVESVDVVPHETPQASMARLAVRYSANSDPAAPRTLRLKVAPPAAHPSPMPSAEVAFYRLVAPRMPGFPTPRCFDAAQTEDGARWHLLIEDASTSHDQPPYPVPPPEPQCVAAVACLAELHGAWWEHPELRAIAAAAGVRVRTAAELPEVVERTERTVQAFLDFLGDRLSAPRRRIYERLLASQAPLRRRQMARPHTLAHGDAHWWNFLYPRGSYGGGDRRGRSEATTASRVLLIDWAFWTAGPALEDLAHAITLAWFPERQQRLERPLLQHYHRKLCRRGVSAYNWEACWEDYRIFAATRPFTLAFQWQRKGWPLVWWNNLERAMLAFDDLRCEELLER